MSYDAALRAKVKDKLARLEIGVAWRVREAIAHLCEDPSSLSHPSTFPHAQGFQLFETRLTADGESYFLKVFFFYSQDEQSLLIDDFVLMPLS